MSVDWLQGPVESEELMPTHKVVSREEWLKERIALLKREKAYTRERDEISRQRRELPWVRIEKDYEFDSPEGRVRFADLFRGRSQLWVQSVMQGPGQPLQCVGCALGIDHTLKIRVTFLIACIRKLE